MSFFIKDLWFWRLRRLPALSLLVTVVSPVVLFFAPRFTSKTPGNFEEDHIFPSSKIGVFVWDDSWQSRRGRLVPDTDDWRAILDAVVASGARSLIVADENAFSRNRAAEPGYVDLFQQAKDTGLGIYAPVRLAKSGESFRSANTARLGMPIERFISDETSPGTNAGPVTTTHDLMAIPQLKGERVVGPAPEFLDTLAGVGVISSDLSSLVPIYRWREDRLIADLGLAPRDTSVAVEIRGGDVFVNDIRLAVNNHGVLALPASVRFASYTGNLDAIGRVRGAEVIVVGPAGSPYLDRLVGIANAASHRQLPASSSWHNFAFMMLVGIVGAFTARIHSVGMSLTTAVTAVLLLMLVPKQFFIQSGLAELMGFNLLAAFMIPFSFEVIRRAFRRDARIRYVAQKMTEFELEKLAMARQARMLVHDLRRLIKPEATGASEYLEGFLAEFAALDGGGRTAAVDSLSIVTLVRGQVSQAGSTFERRQLRCSMRWRHRSRIVGDSVNVRRVIDNLLMNAAAASPVAGDISISSTEEMVELTDGAKLCCVLRFENTVADNASDNVFSVLSNERQRDSGENSGGLGLIIVHRLVSALGGSVGGEIVVAEDSVRKAVVQVALPVDRMLPDMNVLTGFEARSAWIENGENIAGAPLRETASEHDSNGEFRPLIVVDDSPFVRDFWERQARNYEVFCIKNPSELLELLASADDLKSRRPLVVMDYHFEGSILDGVSTAKKLREIGVLDIVISSDWDLGPLELKDLQIPVVKKSEATLEQLLSAIAATRATGRN